MNMVVTSTDRSILLSSAGISIDGDAVLDVTAPGIAERLRARLGPVVASHAFPGVPRTVEVLDAGVVLLEEASGELVSLFVCFDPEASPYPHFFASVPGFRGTLTCAAGMLRGGESARGLEQTTGERPFAGAIEVRDGALHLGLRLLRSPNRFGKRTGSPRLAAVSASWGGLKPFPPRAPQPRQ